MINTIRTKSEISIVAKTMNSITTTFKMNVAVRKEKITAIRRKNVATNVA